MLIIIGKSDPSEVKMTGCLDTTSDSLAGTCGRVLQCARLPKEAKDYMWLSDFEIAICAMHFVHAICVALSLLKNLQHL